MSLPGRLSLASRGQSGTILSASYQCGTSDLGNSYSLVDYGVVVISKKAPTIAWAYRFKRM